MTRGPITVLLMILALAPTAHAEDDTTISPPYFYATHGGDCSIPPSLDLPTEAAGSCVSSTDADVDGAIRLSLRASTPNGGQNEGPGRYAFGRTTTIATFTPSRDMSSATFEIHVATDAITREAYASKGGASANLSVDYELWDAEGSMATGSAVPAPPGEEVILSRSVGPLEANRSVSIGVRVSGTAGVSAQPLVGPYPGVCLPGGFCVPVFVPGTGAGRAVASFSGRLTHIDVIPDHSSP